MLVHRRVIKKISHLSTLQQKQQKKKEEGRKETTHIKSNNPHLTGGEKKDTSKTPASAVIISITVQPKLQMSS